MRLVLARHRRPVTRVRHTGGFSFLKTRVWKKIFFFKVKDDFPKLKLGVIRNPLPPLLQPLSPPSSRSRRSLLYAYAHARLCPASPRSPLVTSSVRPSEHGSVDDITPPWRFVWGGTTMTEEWDTAERNRRCWLRVCPCEPAPASCCV